MQRLIDYMKDHRFSVISWGATVLLVAAILTSTIWLARVNAAPAAAASSPTAAGGSVSGVGLPPAPNQPVANAGIGRQLALKTDVSLQTNAKPITYRVMVGDSVFAIAKQYSIKPESILYSNEATLNDNPSNLSPGMELTIPPVDGLTYTWKEGDTLDKVADEFKSDLNGDGVADAKDAALLQDAIVSYPGNNLDLTNPVIKPGQVIMIPGGHRELISWLEFVPTSNRSGGSTATSELGGGACPGAAAGSPPGLWPTNGPHTVSGNEYSPSHLGIDITATPTTLIYASGAGVVVFASFSKYGYGNVIEIDHGVQGFATVYAHLSQINVSPCQYVTAGEVIGIAGCTGNCTGTHLHFEVREGGVNINPWSILQ
jgi:murein DD-endopeptidase MepM/ murein hydrolase activator NlpD